jgi:LysM repeat protein
MQDDEPRSCSFCNRYAEHTCKRCGRAYCDAHGRELCESCLAPAGALPSQGLYRGSLIALLIAAVAGVLVLFVSPTLPGEKRLAGAVSQNPSQLQPQRSVTGRTPAATAAPTQPASPTAAALRSYTVVLNDTLSGIAESFGTSVAAIQAANPGVNQTNLKAGQELLIPPPGATPVPTGTPTVTPSPTPSASPTPAP